jgi:hypothetical protein
MVEVARSRAHRPRAHSKAFRARHGDSERPNFIVIWEVMQSYALSQVTDEELLADLHALVVTDRQTTAALLAHLAEVDARELFLPAACTSMHVYCVRVLRLAEEVAYKRIRAARAARRYPQIFDAIADGRLHVTGIVVLAPHLTDANVDEVLAAAAHRSKAELEMLVAGLAPKPDVPAFIAPVDPQTSALGVLQLDPDPAPGQRSPPPVTRTTPLAPDRFALQVTVSQATRDKLERAQALMRHRNPSGDLAEVVDRALDALLEKLEKQKFAATTRPRAKKARPDEANPRYVPNDVKRDVHERDGEQCTFVGANGERCTENGFLELDHRTPVALGGQSTADGMRVLCKPHNQYEANRILGAELMQRKLDEAKQRRADAAASVELDTQVADALRRLGFKAADAQRAVAALSRQPAATFEERIRAALALLSRWRGSRCSESVLVGGLFGG